MEQKQCYYCNVKLVHYTTNKKNRHAPPNGYTKDHLLPRDRGGIGTRKVACCCKCNTDKGRLTLEEYRAVCAYRRGVQHKDFVFPGEKYGYGEIRDEQVVCVRNPQEGVQFRLGEE